MILFDLTVHVQMHMCITYPQAQPATSKIWFADFQV